MLDKVSRRRMMELGIGAATAGVVPVSKSLAYASGLGATNDDFDLPGGAQLQGSIKAAYTFLRQMMDAYAPSSTVRLCQSYCDQIAGGTFFSTAFTYDNALLALAFLAPDARMTLRVPRSSATLSCMRNKPILLATGACDRRTWRERRMAMVYS